MAEGKDDRPDQLILRQRLSAEGLNEDEAWVIVNLFGWDNPDGSIPLTSVCLKRSSNELSDIHGVSPERWAVSRFISSTLRHLMGPNRRDLLANSDLELFTQKGFTDQELAWMCTQLDIVAIESESSESVIERGKTRIRYLPPEKLALIAVSAIRRLIGL